MKTVLYYLLLTLLGVVVGSWGVAFDIPLWIAVIVAVVAALSYAIIWREWIE